MKVQPVGENANLPIEQPDGQPADTPVVMTR